jgi:hypothetical protein
MSTISLGDGPDGAWLELPREACWISCPAGTGDEVADAATETG